MTPSELEGWLVKSLAARLRVQSAEIDPVRPIEEYGIDSMEAVALTAELEEILDITIPPTALWDYSSLRDLAHFLTVQCTQEDA